MPITRKKHLTMKNQRIEYELNDVYSKLRDQNVKINFNVEVMPIFGYIFRVKEFTFYK